VYDRGPTGVRLPGQYYDAESGLHYNTFRDYDPATGRYIESDPLGLEGGINTYAYVDGNPLSSSDSSGLAASYCMRNPTALGCGPLEGGFGGGMSRGGTATAGPDPVGFCLKLIGSVVGALAGTDACGGQNRGPSEHPDEEELLNATCDDKDWAIPELEAAIAKRKRLYKESGGGNYGINPSGPGHKKRISILENKLKWLKECPEKCS